MAPFKSSLARSVGKLLGVYKETDLSLRGGVQSSRVPIPPFSAISATGGSTFTPGDGYKYHIYTNAGSNPFNVTDAGSPGAIEYVLIAGGGGGADRGNGAGGGGAGGVFGHGMELPGSAHQAGAVTVTVQNYALVIGAGGQGAPENSGGEGAGSNGTPSTGFGKTAVGGGGGGQNNVSPGAGGDGGSGGGGDNTKPAGAGQNYPGPTQQGFPGGEANEPGGGGGGGAGGVGFDGNANPNPGGGGFGIGFSWAPSSYGTTGPDGSKRYFAGGGQGGDSSPGSGGYGGGGDMRSSGANGTGGGAGSGDDSGSGGTGGSGFIAVRYSV